MSEGSEKSLYRSPKDQTGEQEREQKKLTRFAIWDKKHLWAMVHNATPDALKELYEVTMYRFGLGELGNLIRDYLKKHSGYGSPVDLGRCPYCGSEDQKDQKVGAGKATKKDGKSS